MPEKKAPLPPLPLESYFSLTERPERKQQQRDDERALRLKTRQAAPPRTGIADGTRGRTPPDEESRAVSPRLGRVPSKDTN